ncbi:protein-tyrosine phosphatase-like protein [Collybia nuda]|uniref:protein-tyrosine-phosphatase n=1 Tax=Collybia nuda TaxID=64659 RepID=A0A9P5Y6X3_9AGAR|nr:protein-tyrosine phosphatase-like protein [Collybia nuda]
MDPGALKATGTPKDPNMDMIIPGLYLGNAFSGLSESRLKKHGITHILSVASVYYVPEGLLERKSVEFDDNADVDLMVHFTKTNAYISNALEKGGVLVHCLRGVSRSATVVAAYLMATRRLSYQEAVDFIKSRRPMVNPNPGFIRQLELYGAAHCNTNTVEGGCLSVP